MPDWLNKYKIRLEELPEPRVTFTQMRHEQAFKYQKAFGYTSEELDNIVAPMAADGKGARWFNGEQTFRLLCSAISRNI
jgi:hypothetical protein